MYKNQQIKVYDRFTMDPLLAEPEEDLIDYSIPLADILLNCAETDNVRDSPQLEKLFHCFLTPG